MADLVNVSSALKKKRIDLIPSSVRSLPEPLLIEILIRLPTKSCFRYKSVSQGWLSLISQPYFIRQFIHRRLNSSNPSFYNEYGDVNALRILHGAQKFFPFTIFSSSGVILVPDPTFKSSESTFSFLPFFRVGETTNVSVLACWRDLLLCCPNEYYHRVYYICNPLTRQWIRLPDAPRKIKFTRAAFIVDPFYQLNGNDNVDLNFRLRFKVVRFVQSDRLNAEAEIYIFCSETGKWSRSLVHPYFQSTTDLWNDNARMFENRGKLHWWSLQMSGMISFDPSTGSLLLTKKPVDLDMQDGGMALLEEAPRQKIGLGSCQGIIRLCQFLPKNDAFNNVAPLLSMWELEDSESGNWRLLHKVYVKDMIPNHRCLVGHITSEKPGVRHILIHLDDKDLVYIIFKWFYGLYNFRTQNLTIVGRVDPESHFLRQPELSILQLQCWPTPVL